MQVMMKKVYITYMFGWNLKCVCPEKQARCSLKAKHMAIISPNKYTSGHYQKEIKASN